MSSGEFALIDKYFKGATHGRRDVWLGIGDDCALVTVSDGHSLAVTVDTLVEGRHFFAGAEPEALGHKCLAVNLSDLAAMAATPCWATLALTLPTPDEQWIAAFVSGFSALARRFAVELIGGDTTRGPLAISIQAMGSVCAEKALRRDGASVGDLIFVTGQLGDAGLALRMLPETTDPLHNAIPTAAYNALIRPEPRVTVGLGLGGLASAAIDISDGLISDLGHICKASGVGARIELARLPVSQPVRADLQASGSWALPLAAGDDYELCFTIAARHDEELALLAANTGVALTCIGRVEAAPGVRCIGVDGCEVTESYEGFDHFRASD